MIGLLNEQVIMSRGGLVIASLCAVAAVAIILSKSGDLRVNQRSSPPVLESVDPYVLEKRLIAGKAETPLRQKAERYLKQARESFSKRNPEIQKLIAKAESIDSRLASQSAAEARIQKQLDQAKRQIRGLANTKREKSGLHMTIGWPQRGGAMPTTYGKFGLDQADSNKAIDSSNEMYVNNDDDERRNSARDVAGTYIRENSDVGSSDADDYNDDSQYDDQDQSDYNSPAVTIGVVDGRSGKEVFYPEEPSSWILPFTWFMRGSDDKPAASSTPAADQQIVKTPEVERIDRLLKIRRKEKALEEEKENLMDRLYDDATNGRLSTQDGSQAAEAFSAGFLQGAVEASRKSVKAQGEFAEQLQRQSEIVDELEKVVRELEAAQQKKDFEATAASAAGKKEEKSEEKEEKEDDEERDKKEQKPKKIQIDFYMEAGCPGCKAFTTSVLTDVLNAVGDYVNLRAIPYGNAQLNNSVIKCQHGEDECVGNKIELCMMDKYGKNNDWQAWFPAFKCIEKSDETPLNASRTCLADSGMDVNAIIQCATGNEGDLLHMQAAKQTIDLDPPHTFTPWIVLDGAPVKDKVMDLLSLVCEKLAPETKSKIPQCNPKFKATAGSTSLSSRPRRKIKFCYPNDPLSRLLAH